MLLCELFDSGNNMEEKLRQAALEIITPYHAQGLPFVTMQQVIDKLRPHSGLDITRALLLKILDPNKVKAVDRIEGDHIVFADQTEGEEQHDDLEAQQKQAEQNQQQVNDMAMNAAQNQMQQG